VIYLPNLLQKYPNAPVAIEGHTDSVGSAQSNHAPSEEPCRRRQAVAGRQRYLAFKALDQGVGPSVPIASNDTPEGRQRNRRVEIRVQK
jgi:outer membrane protein OmpA-like peptidoglycan-associated protein